MHARSTRIGGVVLMSRYDVDRMTVRRRRAISPAFTIADTDTHRATRPQYHTKGHQNFLL